LPSIPRKWRCLFPSRCSATNCSGTLRPFIGARCGPG
jgi:hypothetical protein